MSGYHAGREVEYAVVHHFTDHGWATVRAASSKGAADVVAFGPGVVALINVKRTDPPGPAERLQLWNNAQRSGCLPLVALRPVRQPLTFRRLTGPGPSDWVAWDIGDAT